MKCLSNENLSKFIVENEIDEKVDGGIQYDQKVGNIDQIIEQRAKIGEDFKKIDDQA